MDVSLLKSAPLLVDLLLGTADEYRFLTGGSIPVPGQSDSENFTQTMDSMGIMGFTPEEKLCKRGNNGEPSLCSASLIPAINAFSCPCHPSAQPCLR